jgi:hypothetical protein
MGQWPGHESRGDASRGSADRLVTPRQIRRPKSRDALADSNAHRHEWDECYCALRFADRTNMWLFAAKPR